MGVRLTKEQWHEFKQSAIGETILRQLSEVRQTICESMGGGGCVGQSIEETALNYTLNSGQIQGIDWVLIPEIMEEEDGA